MKAKQRNLVAMIDQEGLPTMFQTFSQANTYWDDLFQILKEFDVNLREENLDHVERQKRVKIACENNPHIVNTFFIEKFNLQMKEFLIPTMKIESYWVTFEWQKRNACHAHVLIWTKDSIDIIKAMRDKN